MMRSDAKSRPVVAFALCLFGILIILFFPSFHPAKVLFSNDGPLGVITADNARMPGGLTGLWLDLNTVGHSGGSFFLSITSILLWVLGPLYFAKFYVATVLAILGACAWFCLRRLQLTPVASALGAFAAMLNSAFFSAAAWGVGQQIVLIAMTFLAVGLLTGAGNSHRWLRVVLAGCAVGMGIMEGFDLGALFSLLVAAFVLYQELAREGSFGRKALMGVARVAVVAVCAAVLAFQALSGLIETQIKGVAVVEQDTRTKIERWDWATQWSLPKREALGIVVAGLFGYRMDTPDGGNYWGAAGRDPAWDRYFEGGKQGNPPGGFLRYSGGGSYAGVLVALVAVWCVLESRRKERSCFTPAQKKLIWFWGGVVVVTLLLAFGRHAPFYQFLYMLPYFSTIRNPAKFLHLLSFALVVLFAYGVHGLSQRYLQNPLVSASGGLRGWWSRAGVFDKRWVMGTCLVLGTCVLGWLIYASSRPGLEQYLQTVQFDEPTARSIVSFSLRQVGLFVLFLGLSVGLLVLVMSGRFAGKRATAGGVLLGLLLVVDLGRANLPFIIHWDYKHKYATNPVIEFFRNKPYEHRVAILPFSPPPQVQLLNQLYRIEWAQHHFQYFNIQSLDIVQMPRMPADLVAFETALHFDGNPTNIHRITRRWELTNTRYLLGAAGFLPVLNQELDPARKRFQPALLFNIEPKPGELNPTQLHQLTASTETNGQYAVFEFTGALPRTKLYTNWQVSTNDDASLQTLASPSFDPWQSVLVAQPLPPPSATSTNPVPGTVEFASYAPKRLVLSAKASAPSVLLLNDKFHPHWKVKVDGKPETLLRCNYIMRGVQVPAGEHQIEFAFAPPTTPLYVSLGAILVAGLLVGVLMFGKEKEAAPVAAPPEPRPAKQMK